jgi:hypothetical protein
MSRAVATLEIRNAAKLTLVQAHKLARMLAVRKKTCIVKVGPVRVELHVAPQAGRALLARWLEEQGCKVIFDRTNYSDIYTAKLFSSVPVAAAA